MGTLNDLFVKVGMDVTEFISGTVTVARELEGMAKAVEKNFASLDGLGSRLTEIGSTIGAAFGAPLAAFGALAVKAAVDFDDASDRIRAKTGATGDALAGLNTIFKDVFSSLPTTAKDASEAISLLATKTGLAGEPLKELVVQELNLARVTESSLVPLINATTRAFEDWSSSALTSAEKLDFLFKVTQGTGVNIQKLNELMVQFGAPMRALGIDFEHAAAMLGQFEKAGVNIQTVMPGLRMELGRFAKVGIDASTGFNQIIDSIKNAKTNAEQLTIAVKVFGARAATDMVDAIKSGRFALDSLVEGYKKAGDSINKAAADTLSFTEKLKVFKNSLETSLAPLGTVITGIFEKWLDGAKPFLKSLEEMATGFSHLTPEMQKFIFIAAGAPVAIGGIVTGIGLAMKAFSSLAPEIALAIGGVTAFIGAIGNVGTAVALGMTGALTTGETIILRMGQAAILAAAAFAAWELGSWAYKNIPAVKALGDAIADVILKIPGMQANLMKGAQEEIDKATSATVFTNQKLEDSLKRIGVVVDKTGLSAEQYGAKLRDAAKGTEQYGAASDAANPKLKNQAQISAELKAKLDELATGNARAAAGALAHAAALEKQKDHAIAAWAALDKVEGKLDGLSNVKKIELFAFGPDLLKEINNLKAYGDALERVLKIQTLDGAAKGTRNLKQAMDELMSSFGNLSAAQERFGQTTELMYKQEIEDNKKALDTILKDTTTSLALKSQAMITAGERDVQAARNAGKAVSDASILSLQGMKTAYTAMHMDIEQAWKTLGITTTQQFQNMERVAVAAYEKIKNASTSSAQDILKAEAGLYAARLNAQEAAGDRATETQKRQLAKLVDESQHGINTLAKQWDLFANHIGDAFSRGLDQIALTLLEGGKVGNIKNLMSALWKDIAKSFVTDFIHPVTEEIGKFVSGALKSLIAGMLGVKKSSDDAAVSLLDFFRTKNKETTHEMGSGVGDFAGDTSEADSIPGMGGSGGGSTSGIGGITGGILNLATGIVSATTGGINLATGIVSATTGVIMVAQLMHLNTAAGRIEESTRKTWIVTGEQSDAIVITSKLTSQYTKFALDRMVEIRDALFAPVALTLEMIHEAIKHIGGVAAGAASDASEAAAAGEVWNGDIKEIIQNGINGNVEEGKKSQAIANGIAGNLEIVKGSTGDMVTGTNDLANGVAFATAVASDNGSAIKGSIVESGDGIVNALGQNSADVVAATNNSTASIVARLEAMSNTEDLQFEVQKNLAEIMGGIGPQFRDMTNAYTDLKTGLIGVVQTSTKQLTDAQDATSRAFNDAIFGSNRNKEIGMNNLERDGFVDLQNNMNEGFDWVAYQIRLNNPAYSTTQGGSDLGNALTVPSWAQQYLTPQGTNPQGSGDGWIGDKTAVNTGGGAGTNPGFSMGPMSDAERYGNTGAGGRTGTVVIQFNGTVTDKEFQKTLMTEFARQQLLANL